MELQNVLDKLREIAENYESEDVSRAINTVNGYAQLAEKDAKPDFADIDGDGDKCEPMKKAADEVEESEDDFDQFKAANDKLNGNGSPSIYPDAEGDAEVEESGDEGGSALDRVRDRATRSGEGGPVDRIQSRRAERYAELEEQLGMVFQTPMERHTWIMNQLNDLSKQLDPEDAQALKSIMQKVGNADVKGGNC